MAPSCGEFARGGCPPSWGFLGRGFGGCGRAWGGGRGGFGFMRGRGGFVGGGFPWGRGRCGVRGGFRPWGRRGVSWGALPPMGGSFGWGCSSRGHGPPPFFRWGAGPGRPSPWHGPRDAFFDETPLADFITAHWTEETDSEPEPEHSDDAERESAEPADADAGDDCIWIDTRRFRPEDVCVDFDGAWLRVVARRRADDGQLEELRQQLHVPSAATVQATLRRSGYLQIRAVPTQ